MSKKNRKELLLYENLDLISKLKPAFEQVVDDEELPQTTLKLEDMSVSTTKSCSTCEVSFETTEEQRSHFKLDWHRFNIQLKLKGSKCISEEQFEASLDDNLSVSGSESETEEEIIGNKAEKLPKLFLSHVENLQQVYSIQKAILPDFTKDARLKWAIFMLGGGHFAGAIFDKNQVVVHKTFHCYTVRAKQGGGQSAADNKSGSRHPKSAGASLRRYNEASLEQHVQDILANWKTHIDDCSLIFYRAVSGNRKVLFSGAAKSTSAGKSQLLNKNDKRLVSIPFPTRRATFKEVQRVHQSLMTIELHGESLDQLKARFLDENRLSARSPSKGSKPKKNQQIRRSKSRDSPKRELPDFVQSLADEADSESDQAEGFLQSDLQEFEVSRKASKKKKETSHLIELQNSLVTASKSGDVKLFNLLVQSDVKAVQEQINHSFGEHKLTLLHIASREGHGKMIQLLMENGADPTLKDKAKKTPYSCCPDKNCRTIFRRYQASFPEQWDYIKAGFPSGPLLTEEEENRMANKKAEKKKAQRAAKKEKEKEENAKEMVKKQEEIDKQRFLNLSDREKRALAAEKRMLAQQETLPSVSRCFQCGADISGKVPFEYSDYRFCKPACVKEHRAKSK